MRFDEGVVLPWNRVKDQLRSVSRGQNDRLYDDGFSPDWLLKEQAEAELKRIKEASLHQGGMIDTVMHPDGDGYAVMTSLSARGQALLDCLDSGLVWACDRSEPDIDKSIRQWTIALESNQKPNSELFTLLGATTHPSLAVLRDKIEHYRLRAWTGVLGKISRHTDSAFQQIEALPSPFYDMLKAEAMHHRMRIWTPK